MNNAQLKLVTQLLPRVRFEVLNPRPVDRKSNALAVAPPRHRMEMGLVQRAIFDHYFVISQKRRIIGT